MNRRLRRTSTAALALLGVSAMASSSLAQPAAGRPAAPAAAPAKPIVAAPVAAPVAAAPVAAPPVAPAPVEAPPVAAVAEPAPAPIVTAADAALTPTAPAALTTAAAQPAAALPTDALPTDALPANALPAAAVTEPPSADVATAEPPPEAKKPAGFFIQTDDGNYKLKLGAVMQPRLTYTAADAGDDQFGFSVERARLTLGGHAITQDLGYFLHFGWDGGGVPGLKDAWLDYKFGSDLQLRAGQMKKPFSRQALMSDSTLEFVDRALVTGQYGSIGDIGVMLHDNVSESPKFEYAVGVFNGTGAAPVYAIDVESDPAKLSSTTTPRRLSPLVVARFGYNHGDVKAYSEGDLEGGPCRFGIAGATQLQLDADTNDSSGVAATLDFIVKFHGFSTTGAYFVGWASTGDFADQEYARSGMNLQASYVIQKMIEPGVRYSRDLRKGTDNDSQEILGVVGFYPWGGHGFKVQLDAGALVRETAEAKATDIRVRAQTQVAF